MEQESGDEGQQTWVEVAWVGVMHVHLLACLTIYQDWMMTGFALSGRERLQSQLAELHLSACRALIGYYRWLLDFSSAILCPPSCLG